MSNSSNFSSTRTDVAVPEVDALCTKIGHLRSTGQSDLAEEALSELQSRVAVDPLTNKRARLFEEDWEKITVLPSPINCSSHSDNSNNNNKVVTDEIDSVMITEQMAKKEPTYIDTTGYLIPDVSALLEQMKKVALSNPEHPKNSPNTSEDLKEYIYEYGFGDVGRSLRRLEKVQIKYRSREALEAWARDWALKLSEEDEEAWLYNGDRKKCLSFLYKIIDAGMVMRFADKRVNRIVKLCLVMDRANALYNMIDHDRNVRGLHWFAKADREGMRALLMPLGEELPHRAPLNKRLRGLLDLQEFGFKLAPAIIEWMQPQRAEPVEMH